MKRVLFAALLAIVLAGGYYFGGPFFGPDSGTRVARPSAAQSVVADVVVEMEAPIEVMAIGTVQPIAVVNPDPRPNWTEEDCGENNHVLIGHEDYMLSADGLLMPQHKGQSPPDLRYFKQTQK
jgi:hypothetical protein